MEDRPKRTSENHFVRSGRQISPFVDIDRHLRFEAKFLVVIVIVMLKI